MSKKNKKTKKSKGRKSDQVHIKKFAEKAAATKINPFEVKINRSKHDILGRSRKQDRGLPGISRQKTFTKRKNTLLKEYQLQGKNNVFADKRIGEKEFMSSEEKTTARLIAQRSKHQKNSVYNLNEDDEEITHLGIPVSEIERHNDIHSDSDSDENLDSDFVSKVHFGGFLTKKDESKASHKDMINDMIAQSKQRKHEKQVLKDATLEMTETLDEKWKELRKLIPNKIQDSKPLASNTISEPTNEDFDTIMKKLKFQSSKHIERNVEKAPFIEDPVPTSFDEFKQLASGLNHEQILAIIENIIKNNSQPENKKKLEHMFGILLRYIEELCCSESIPFKMLDALTVHLHSVAIMFPVSSSEYFLNVICFKHQQLRGQLEEKRCRKSAYPTFETLVLLRLSSILFTTPHTYHSVLTPCILFICQILNECKAKDACSIISSLFLCSNLLQCAATSKQLIPEALTFLLNVLQASVKSEVISQVQTSIPDLSISQPLPSDIDWALPLSQLKQKSELCDLIKAKVLKLALDISGQFATLYKNMESFKELFEPFEKVTSILLRNNCPDELKNSVKKLMRQVQQKPLKVPLAAEKRKPKMLKLYEPKIETREARRQTREDSRKKLLPKYKRELKGAVREVRRDNAFLAQHMLRERMEHDQERKHKVNKLYQELAEQEGAFRSLTKRKKK